MVWPALRAVQAIRGLRELLRASRVATDKGRLTEALTEVNDYFEVFLDRARRQISRLVVGRLTGRPLARSCLQNATSESSST